MRQAVESARMGWGLATVCGVAGKGETLDIIPRFLITGRRVAGSSFGGVKGRDQVPQFVDRYLAGEIDVDAFVSHKLTLDEVNRGFELMEAQDGIRSVIDFACRELSRRARPGPQSGTPLRGSSRTEDLRASAPPRPHRPTHPRTGNSTSPLRGCTSTGRS
jgi:hypothetical protein